MKKLFNKFKEQKTMKKLLILSAVMLVVLSSSATAIWLLGMETPTITGFVTSSDSGDILSFSVALQDIGTIDATNDTISINSTGEIFNSNGFLENFIITIDDVIIDLEDECISNNDITTEWFIDGVKVLTNDTISLDSGATPISWTVTAVHGACPGNVTGSLSIYQ